MDYSAYFPILRRTPLMQGMTDEALQHLMTCFAPRVRSFSRGELLLLAGYETREVGILLEGSITATKTMPDGSSVVMAHLSAGGMFGDVLTGGALKSPVTVRAATPCTALFLPRDKMLRPCGMLHPAHLTLLERWVESISGKYFALERRLELLTIRSLRARIGAWLLEESTRAQSDTFTTPMTRAELAGYLNCERSALSRELSRMQRDGLIETYRSSFKLLAPHRL